MKAPLKRSRTELKTAIAAATAVLLLLCGSCGCFLGGSAFYNTEDGQSDGTGGVPTAAPATPEPTLYLPENPVFALFEDYLSDRAAAEEGMLVSVYANEDPLMAEAYSAFCSSGAELTLIYATVGMLASDGSGFGGSFTETYDGSGSMSSRGVFEYIFDDGRTLAGRIEDGVIEAGCGILAEPESDEPTPLPTEAPTPEPDESESPEETGEAPTFEATEAPAQSAEAAVTAAPEGGAEFLSGAVYMTLKRTEEGWIAVVRRGGSVYITEILGGAIYFACVPEGALPSGVEPADGVAGVSPARIGRPILIYENGAAVLQMP